MDALLKTASTALASAVTPGTHHDLYAGVDRAALGPLDRLWIAWFELFGNPVLATAVAAFVLHEVVYFGRCLPFMWMDSRPDLFLKYKIQPKQHISAAEQWRCTKTVLYNHFSFELPQMMAFHPMAVYVGMKTYEVPLPTLKTMTWQLALFFFVEDTWHYWGHRLFHIGFLYRTVHKLHHKYQAPFGLAAEFSSPVEIMVFGFGTVFGPLICCHFFGEMHLFTMLAWITLRMLQAIDSHCGYDFPYSLRQFFPLWAGADHHDYHHQAFKGCYASSFRHWDYLMGTEGNYHKVRLQQRREKALSEGKIVFGRKEMARAMGQEERVKVE